MKILYGSQTGTAEEFAKTLAGEAKRHGFVPRVVDLEDFKPEEGALKRFELFFSFFFLSDSIRRDLRSIGWMMVLLLELTTICREVGGMLVFMVATYGDGEPTDNAKAFHDWIIDEVKTGSVNGEQPFKVKNPNSFLLLLLPNHSHLKGNSIRGVWTRQQDVSTLQRYGKVVL